MVRQCGGEARGMKKPKETADERRARHTREYIQKHKLEERQRRDAIIAEFSDDKDRMADEILRYRHCVRQLTDALDWINLGASFIALASPLELARRRALVEVPNPGDQLTAGSM
jgi:hypothetical protein